MFNVQGRFLSQKATIDSSEPVEIERYFLHMKNRSKKSL